VSFTNFPFWNVVSAVRHPGAHARDVAFDTVQTHVPNPDFNSFGERFVEKIGTRLAPERGLEGKIEFFGDGTFEQPLAFMPFRAPGRCMRMRRESNSALKVLILDSGALARAVYSSMEIRTALGASCFVITTTPPCMALSSRRPNLFFASVAVTKARSLSAA